jgi:hypothetical protein
MNKCGTPNIVMNFRKEHPAIKLSLGLKYLPFCLLRVSMGCKDTSFYPKTIKVFSVFL